MSESIALYTALRERSRELFLGVLGHDLRTPIGTVLVSADVLLLEGNLTSSQEMAASQIVRSGARIEQTVADRLNVAHVRLGGALPIETKRVNLAATCEQVVQGIRALNPATRPIAQCLWRVFHDCGRIPHCRTLVKLGSRARTRMDM